MEWKTTAGRNFDQMISSNQRHKENLGFTLATFYVNNRSPGPGLCLWLRARIFLGECFRSGVNMWQMECFRSKGSHVTCGHWRRQFLEKEDSVAGRDSHWLWMQNWKTRLVVGVNIIGGWILYPPGVELVRFTSPLFERSEIREPD